MKKTIFLILTFFNLYSLFAQGKNQNVDIDFTKFNYNMSYAQIFQMMIEPEKYIGKKIKIRGSFYIAENEGRRFYSVLNFDSTACCSTGFIFELQEDLTYPDDFPAEFTTIEVTGIYEKKQLNKNEEYTCLSNARMTVVK
ncbi:MAG: hypothetical protein ACI4LX_11350 [Treponema sp.]